MIIRCLPRIGEEISPHIIMFQNEHSVPLAPVTTATLPVRSVFSTFFSITSSCYSCIHWLEYNRKRRSLPEYSYYKTGKFYAFSWSTSMISSGCRADGIVQNRKNDRLCISIGTQKKQVELIKFNLFGGCGGRI